MSPSQRLCGRETTSSQFTGMEAEAQEAMELASSHSPEPGTLIINLLKTLICGQIGEQGAFQILIFS